jgi:hypothetical protein
VGKIGIAHRTSVGEPDGQRIIGRPRANERIDIKMGLE